MAEKLGFAQQGNFAYADKGFAEAGERILT
jgi:hypothetical protein